MHILYCLTFQNGKKYIGQTVRAMQTRFVQHKNSAKRGSLLPVHCAWRMHGEPQCDVLAEYETHEELHAAEIAAINAMNTMCPSGYNVSYGGETAPSKNPEVAAKIAKAATGRKYKNTDVWVESSTVMWKSDEYRQKVSDGLKASWSDERRIAAKARMDAFWAKRKADGWSMPEAQKEKISARVVSDETRKKMSESAQVRERAPVKEETRKKLSANAKKQWQDQDHANMRVAAITASWTEDKKSAMASKAAEIWKNPEVRAKRIESMRAAHAAKKQVN